MSFLIFRGFEQLSSSPVWQVIAKYVAAIMRQKLGLKLKVNCKNNQTRWKLTSNEPVMLRRAIKSLDVALERNVGNDGGYLNQVVHVCEQQKP